MDSNDVESRTCRLLMLTIGLFCSAELLLNYLDRSNISYASLQMNAELGLDPKAYGFAISIFFIGHILFSVPGAEIGRRLGGRVALGAMMAIWGAIAAAMALVNSPMSLHLLRFSLGVAEAGAAAIVTLLLTNWIPRRSFARTMMLVTMAQPIGQMIGAPFSGLLMTYTDGWGGHAGWRWMFGIEGLLTVGFAVFTWFWLRDTPGEARWLPEDSRRWLLHQLSSEAAQAEADRGGRRSASLWDVLADYRIWIFGLILFSIATGLYLFAFWLPQVIRDDRIGSSTLEITILSALPWFGMMAGMLLFGWSSDRFQERPVHLAIGMLIGAAGIALGSANAGSMLGLVGLALSAFGLGGAITIFWTMPPAYMAGTSGAAAAFAFINVIGNLTGVLTPLAIGRLREASGTFESALYLIIGILLVGMLLIIPVSKRRRNPLDSPTSDPSYSGTA
jgi:ACS family tartrate transporter-like MFS transporter